MVVVSVRGDFTGRGCVATRWEWWELGGGRGELEGSVEDVSKSCLNELRAEKGSYWP